MREDIKELIVQNLGENAWKILEYIMEKKEVRHDELVRRFGRSAAELRKILYKLEEMNIVVMKRRKVSELRYEYIWMYNPVDITSLKIRTLQKEIEELKKKYEEMEDYVFVCQNCNLKFSTEEAYNYEFRCSECGEMLVQLENEEKKKLKEKIEELTRKLNEFANQNVNQKS